MIPVTQTKVVVKNSNGEMVVRGNCFAAAIASLMELPITEVPNVETLFDVENVSWYDVMDAWIKDKGYQLTDNDAFMRAYHDKENECDIYDAKYCHNKYYIVTAMSPRGIMHCCIYQNGKMVHDPHPTREGIDEKTISQFEEIIKIS